MAYSAIIQCTLAPRIPCNNSTISVTIYHHPNKTEHECYYYYPNFHIFVYIKKHPFSFTRENRAFFQFLHIKIYRHKPPEFQEKQHISSTLFSRNNFCIRRGGKTVSKNRRFGYFCEYHFLLFFVKKDYIWRKWLLSGDSESNLRIGRHPHNFINGFLCFHIDFLKSLMFTTTRSG